VVVAAVDLGASSGRVSAARCTPDGGITLREVHRFPNTPVRVGGVLRWDVLALFGGILTGLRKAAEAAGPVRAVGVDGWGVDYGLLDADGQLLGNPVHYRDPRTLPVRAEVLARCPAADLFAASGVQPEPFATLFQLLAERGSAPWEAAAQALLVPDLMSYWLCGEPGAELTNASTTGLLDPRTGTWSPALAARLGIPAGLLPPVRRPGTVLGRLAADVADDIGLATLPQVVAVPSHDTASAVAAIPAASERFAYVCTGSWILAGVAAPAPVTSEEARTAGFTNELGADGVVCFHRNITGFWLLQECLRHWRDRGRDVAVDDLTRAAAAVPALAAVIDVRDPVFLGRGDMPSRVAAAAARTGGAALSGPAEVARCVLDSIALAVRRAVRDASRISGREVDTVHLVGGGVGNALFCQLVADACDMPVVAGPVEAASLGNAVHQARALGVLDGSPAAVRAALARATRPVTYRPDGARAAAFRRADDLLPPG